MKSIADEAEFSLVAAALDDPICYDEANLDSKLFSHPKAAAVWAAIGKCRETDTEVSVFTVANNLGSALEACGGLPGLTEILLQHTDHTPVKHNVDIIRETWLRREAHLLSSQIEKLHQRGASGHEMLDTLQKRIDELQNTNIRGLPTLQETYEREKSSLLADMAALSRGEEIHFGLPTGLGIERVVPGGLPIGKVVALYGESGNFKTTTKNNLVWGVARSGAGSVIDFSFEDDNELTTQRFQAYNSGVSYGKIATRQLSKAQSKFATSLSGSALNLAGKVYLGGDVPPNIDEIIRLSRAYARSHDVRCVVLDYIQLISSDKEQLDRAMRLLQLSAKRDSICYVVVSQVKQDVDFRASKGENARPRLTDMLGTSAFRTAPKLAIGVYRPAKYAPVPSAPTKRFRGAPDYTRLFSGHPRGKDVYRSILELWITKNVLGEPDTVILLSVDVTTGKMQELGDDVKQYLYPENDENPY